MRAFDRSQLIIEIRQRFFHGVVHRAILAILPSPPHPLRHYYSAFGLGRNMLLIIF
jgi:hypothetical protein